MESRSERVTTANKEMTCAKRCLPFSSQIRGMLGAESVQKACRKRKKG